MATRSCVAASAFRVSRWTEMSERAIATRSSSASSFFPYRAERFPARPTIVIAIVIAPSIAEHGCHRAPAAGARDHRHSFRTRAFPTTIATLVPRAVAREERIDFSTDINVSLHDVCFQGGPNHIQSLNSDTGAYPHKRPKEGCSRFYPSSSDRRTYVCYSVVPLSFASFLVNCRSGWPPRVLYGGEWAFGFCLSKDSSSLPV